MISTCLAFDLDADSGRAVAGRLDETHTLHLTIEQSAYFWVFFDEALDSWVLLGYI